MNLLTKKTMHMLLMIVVLLKWTQWVFIMIFIWRQGVLLLADVFEKFINKCLEY